ncbi:hypothetical protein [Arsukibacterium sp.]|uniref:hypothetical protein n=1 Tax=Arsukibacterium sp. TaxID=1977258 RepID=UPI002FDA1352
MITFIKILALPVMFSSVAVTSASTAVNSPVVLIEQLTLTTMQFNPDDGLYRLHFFEKAAAHYAFKAHARCLSSSVKEKKRVEVEITPYSLHIVKCRVLTE